MEKLLKSLVITFRRSSRLSKSNIHFISSLKLKSIEGKYIITIVNIQNLYMIL